MEPSATTAETPLRSSYNKRMKKNTTHPRPADFLLIIFILTFSIGGFFLRSHPQKGTHYLIEVNGKIAYRLSLTSDTLLTIRGKTGEMLIKTEQNRICMYRSSCPLKICEKTGWIQKPGEVIICIPNKIVIRIEGEYTEGPDAVTQ
jgi:hypothetical protein